MSTVAPTHDEEGGAPARWLAEGFAAHAAAWAERGGADTASVAAVRVAADAVSLATAEGHVCIDLGELATGATPRLELASLRSRLLASGVVASPGQGAVAPMVIDAADRLYLHRYFDLERRLAVRLRRAAAPVRDEPGAAARRCLQALFATADENRADVDWQRLAVALALQRRLVIVSGGPGTGKTTLLVALLACLRAETPGLRVALAAPTGKAAARMGEAVREGVARLPEGVDRPPPVEASTIHRLLGTTGRPGVFRHDAANLLPIDALIIDEASMLDLALATRLLEAVPEPARIVLLGDKNQLAAVEAGAVFAELSADPSLSNGARQALARLSGETMARIVPAPPSEPSPLPDCVVWLERNYRFGAESPIGRLAAAIHSRRADEALAVLQSPASEASARWIDTDAAGLDEATLRSALDGFAPLLAAVRGGAADPASTFATFARFRVLCAVREGPRGVLAINRLLARHGRAAAAGVGVEAVADESGSPWYPGRPVLVLRNDDLLGLFNGDVGICLADAAGAPMVFFAGTEGGLRAVPLLRLPAHETAYAMTVHKAQGSEFDQALVVLPTRPSRVVTSELLYTAVTRARHRVVVSSSEAILNAAVTTSTRRASGLLERLREAGAPAPSAVAKAGQAELF